MQKQAPALMTRPGASAQRGSDSLPFHAKLRASRGNWAGNSQFIACDDGNPVLGKRTGFTTTVCKRCDSPHLSFNLKGVRKTSATLTVEALDISIDLSARAPVRRLAVGRTSREPSATHFLEGLDAGTRRSTATVWLQGSILSARISPRKQDAMVALCVMTLGASQTDETTPG